MKIVLGFICGVAAVLSLSAIADELPSLSTTDKVFVYAGGKDADGNGRALLMTKDGRVLAKCD